MTDESNQIDLNEDAGLVSFAGRLLGSPAFFELFERGMSLVEEAANYLDSEGRKASREMERQSSLAYATESMRLTTRLMQLASWLLLQRAVSEGEMTLAQAQEEQKKVKIKNQSIVSNDRNWECLPEELKDLIQRSIRLQEQVLHYDDAMMSSEKVEAPNASPIAGHLNLITEAFLK